MPGNCEAYSNDRPEWPSGELAVTRVTRRGRRPGAVLMTLASLLLLSASPVLLATNEIDIVFVELDDDSRYLDATLFWKTPGQPWGRPYDGAKVALREARFPLQAAGVTLKLERIVVKDPVEGVTRIKALHADGVRFFLLDLPADALAEVAAATRGMPLLLLNVSSDDDRLRQEQCQAHLLHTMPSRAMLSDALMQFLVSRKWRDLLVLRGPSEADARYFAAIERSAKRFGVKLKEVQDFVLGTDPRQRGQNNVALLTSRRNYDVVLVAEALGEFARDVPYQIQQPRPVVGAAGLVPVGWHWAYDRHGAPQLNKRFIKRAKRPMTTEDWSAWIAVKAITEALVRSADRDFDAVSRYLRSNDIVLDGFKGYRLTFRSWNNQMRQPVFLTQANWVSVRAPLDGFLHQTNNLDTLGFDERETRCEL